MPIDNENLWQDLLQAGRRLQWFTPARGEPMLALSEEQPPPPTASPAGISAVQTFSLACRRDDRGSLHFSVPEINVGPWRPLPLSSLRHPDANLHILFSKPDFFWYKLFPLPRLRGGQGSGGYYSLPAGDYVYQFRRSGRPQADPEALSTEVLVGPGGFFFPLPIRGESICLVLTNETESLIQGSWVSSAGRLHCSPASLNLAPQEGVKLHLSGAQQLLPHHQDEVLYFNSQADSSARAALRLSWRQTWEMPVAIPETVSFHLPAAKIGSEVRLPLRLLINGAGVSRLQLFCPTNGWLGEEMVHYDDTEAWQAVELGLLFPLTGLGRVPPPSLKIHLDTGCPLINFRFWELEVFYNPLRIIKNPPILNFLELKPGEPRLRLLQLRLSDGASLNLAYAVPQEFQDVIRVRYFRHDQWVVEADPAALQEDHPKPTVLTIFDRTSGLQDEIPILISRVSAMEGPL